MKAYETRNELSYVYLYKFIAYKLEEIVIKDYIF